MLLGKRPRPRPPMRRTTSMKDISPDVVSNTSTPATPIVTAAEEGGAPTALQCVGRNSWEEWEKRYVTALVSPVGRNAPRRNSGDFTVQPAHFLQACGLCRRSLPPGKDIYMYRGEIAFCSLECRQQHMTQDDKCLVTSMKKDAPSPNAAPPESSSGSGGEAVAAA